MKEKDLAVTIRGLAIGFAVMVLFVCVAIYPFWTSLCVIGTVPEYKRADELEFWTRLLFHWAVSLPYFVVFLIYWLASNDIIRCGLYSRGVVNKFTAVTVILAVDLFVYAIGAILFVHAGWFDLPLVYAVIATIGVVSTLFTACVTMSIKRKMK